MMIGNGSRFLPADAQAVADARRRLRRHHGSSGRSAMSASMPRRAFLRGLTTLPFIGGAVELIGNPRAVAMPVSNQMIFEYGQWLSWERVAAYRELHGGWGSWADDEARNLRYHAAFAVARQLHAERDADGRCFSQARRETYEGPNAGLRSHAYRWHDGAPAASTRAALVLSTVGCDWRGAYLNGDRL